ncbi:MAG: DUF4130 domain-containing protein [Methanothrix sp.]|nr:DUF4130 domain-containing protein [Methanothrix sp.]
MAGLRSGSNYSFYLSLHREFNERLAARVVLIRPEDLEISLKREDIRIRKMADDVAGEVHRMKAFVRLSSLGPNILYGFMKPRHRIGEHVCEHFARRNEGIIVVLGNGRESWICLCRDGRIWRERGSGLEESLVRLKSALNIKESGQDLAGAGLKRINLDPLWRAYYDSQYCPERKNLAAFNRHMPRRDQEAAGMRLVQNKRNASLDDFI